MKNKNLGLYIHIPFCIQKCAYCDFYSVSSEALHKSYIDSLCIQMKNLSKFYFDRFFDTVYIGGGTPSILDSGLIEKLLCGVKESFNLSVQAEFTMEANPATLDERKLSTMKAFGVNRLSIGCQSADDSELKTLGRLHTFADFVETYNLARKCGFDNVSVDLMYSLPSQDLSKLQYSLEEVVALSPEHISLYGLKIEPGTKFFKERDSLVLPDEDTFCDMYLMAGKYLASHGYDKYEISNFAKKGYESRHNLKYWNFDEYLGLGPGAHSFVDGRRFAYSKNLCEYINSVNIGNDPCKDEDRNLTDGDIVNERFMVNMRLAQGVSDYSNLNIPQDKLENYVKNGFIIRDSEGIRFTDEGFLVSNYILSDLISFD